MIETVKWSIQDKKLVINFMSPLGDMLGKVEHDNFPLPDSKLTIFNTSQLNKLIAVVQGEILLEITSHKNTAIKLNISDLNFNVSYALADPQLVREVAEVDEPSEYEIEIILDQEQISNLIKSKNAVGDDNMLIIESSIDLNGNNVLLFTFGENTEHSNKITYSIRTESGNNIKLPFPSDTFKEILSANKDMVEGKILLSEEGLMKLEFVNEKQTKVEYFLVRKSDF
ncbi:MAG: hypothetical protein AABY22_18855 [Nanoarchaeota archaeon]